MNKSLLLVICDFLLLSLMALARFDAPEEDTQQEEVLPDDPIEVQEDIIEALKMSLEMEQVANQNMAQSLEQTQSQLDETAESLSETQENLSQTQENLSDLEKQRAELSKSKELLEQDLEAHQAQLSQTQEELTQVSEQLTDKEQEAREKLLALTALQEELKARQEAVADLEKKAQELESAKNAAEQEKQRLGTQLELAQTETRLTRESLDVARKEIAIVREEKQQLQAQASTLAQGVTSLAEQSEAIAQEVRDAQPVSPNVTFSRFRDSGVSLELRYYKRGEKMVTIRPVVVSDGVELKALFFWDDLGLSTRSDLGASLNLRGSLRVGRYTYPVSRIDFLAADPRVMSVPMQTEWADAMGAEPFRLAPRIDARFDSGVLINRESGDYGEIPYRLILNNERYLVLDTGLFKRMTGEYRPSEADALFSLNGLFLGMSVNMEHAVWVDNFLPANTVILGRPDSVNQLRAGYERLKSQVDLLDSELR